MGIKKRKNKINIDFKYIVLGIVFSLTLVFIFTVYSVKTNRKLNVFEKAVRDSALFIGNVFYIPIDFTKGCIDDINELIDVKKKYNKLKEKEDKINSYIEENEMLKSDIEELKEMLELDDIKTLYNYKNATVLTRNNNNWYNTLNINVGSYHGIEKDMPVLKNNVLIGKISNVSNYSSSVELLTTETLKNKISVIISSDENNIYGLLVGYNIKDNTYLIEGISETENINIGDAVVTSGLSDNFPKGIVIGYVKDIHKDNYDLTRVVDVTPAIDFNNINYVSVIISEEE